MKIELFENAGCFAINMTAEDMKEAALLVRFGMNRTDHLNSAATNVFQDGSVKSHLVFAKNRRADSHVPKRK